MKKFSLFFLFLLCIVPTISNGAAMRTLNVDFSFAAPDGSARQLLGYRLFKEGQQICETNNPNASKITCDILTEAGTFGFTLKAYYADNTESPASPSFPFTIAAVTPSNPVPPTAVLTSSTAAGNAPLKVNFDGSSSIAHNSTIVSYNWIFGDNSQATGTTTSHTFTTAGTFYTQLTVVDNQGLSNTVSTPIVVIGSAPANKKPIAVIATPTSSVSNPLTFSLDGSKSSDSDGSITQYSWNFGDGTTGSGKTVSHTYASANTYTVSLQVTDDRGDTATTSTEIVCKNSLPNAINVEIGEVSIDNNWITVAFENTFNQPVVVAGPPSTNDAEPVLVRIRNINKTGFQVRLQEWDYQDGIHAPEKFNYIVIEKGVYTLDNGSKMEAGTFTGTSSFSQISLQQLYNFTPVILTQVATENKTNAVTGRVRNANQYAFEFMLQEMQTTATNHIPETIGYIAMEPGQGEISGLLYEIGTTTQSVTQNWFNLKFKTAFPSLPFCISGMQTYTGSDTATVRSQNLSPVSIQVKIQEEQSKDSEVRHAREAVGYFTIGAAAK